MTTDIPALVDFFKVLADATRLRIIGLLAVDERSVDELAALVDVRPPTVSHHLAKLKKAGLVSVRGEGTTRWYKLEAQAVERLAREVLANDTWTDIGSDVERTTDDAFARKVLRSFVEGGRITQMPRQWRKKMILLRYVAEQFEAGQVYSEKDIKAILEPIHADHVTLRRMMVDVGWMTRDRAGASYRLVPERLASSSELEEA